MIGQNLQQARSQLDPLHPAQNGPHARVSEAELADLISDGHLERVKAAVEAQPNLNLSWTDPITNAHFLDAALSARLPQDQKMALITYVVSIMPNLDILGMAGDLALQAAMELVGDREIMIPVVKLLLEAGANPNAENNLGRSVLWSLSFNNLSEYETETLLDLFLSAGGAFKPEEEQIIFDDAFGHAIHFNKPHFIRAFLKPLLGPYKTSNLSFHQHTVSYLFKRARGLLSPSEERQFKERAERFKTIRQHRCFQASEIEETLEAARDYLSHEDYLLVEKTVLILFPNTAIVRK